jgi:hypothetical protein
MASFLARTMRAAGVELADGGDAFADDSGSVHEGAVNVLAAAGVVRGTSPTSFAPDDRVTREQMASFLAGLYEAIAGDALPTGPDAFADDDGSWHEEAINALADAGLALGRADGTFGGRERVSRDAMASFLIRTLVAAVDAGAVR